jgi:hypothetical protein
MSEFDLSDDVQPAESPDQEEYEATEREAVSDDTGTVYDGQGQTEATPQDLETDDDSDEE